MVIREKRATLEDLREIESRPENADKYFELINGEIREMAMPTPTHNYYTAIIASFLFNFARSKRVGYVFGDVTSYTLPNGDELIPDASFVSKERVSIPFPNKFFFAPDLAVEVASPSNKERELLDKAESYLRSGTRIVWIPYPLTQVVDVCHLNPEGNLIIRKVDINGTLDGEDVLPGFMLAVKTIFPAE